jgi:hypothetical protein
MMRSICLAILFLPLCIAGQPVGLAAVKTQTFFPVFFTAGYRVPVKNTLINSGHGIYTEAGINPGYLISKKLILGIYAGWAWKDNLWYTSFNRNFVNNYEASINHENIDSSLDSAIINSAAAAFREKHGKSLTMPGCEMTSFHDYSLYYGVILKMPGSYLPMVKVYMGNSRSHYQGPAGWITEGTDYNILQLRRSMYGCELSVLNPVGYFRTVKPLPAVLKGLGLGIYYEYSRLSTASVYFDDGQQQRLIPFRSFISDNFQKNYRNEFKFGFKLSFTII